MIPLPARWLVVAFWLIGSTRWLAPTCQAEDDQDYFERHVRPVLVEHCYACHSAEAEEVRGNLRLDRTSGWQLGGESGPAVIPGDPQQSLLTKAIRYDPEVSPMPPDQKLPAEIVARLEEWIRRGAIGPPEAALAEDASGSAAASPTAANHWAFLPPMAWTSSNTMPPGDTASPGDTVSIGGAAAPSGGAGRVDRILQQHQAELGLQPSASAARHELVRRLYFDLTGLPPTYEQASAFDRASSPNAYGELVESLLASPRFGERWARYWLDVARFADTKGYVFTQDRNYPDAYKYRDWVIDSFNQDRPVDQFIQFQLAADQLDGDRPESLAAMGFLTLGRRFLNNKHDIIDDRIDVTTRGLMGLTVTCARCHDHKYDPIPTADYYSLYGVFANSDEPGDAPAPLRLVDAKQLTEPVVFLRGQPGRRGPEVPRRFLAVLSGQDRAPFQLGSGRLEMAQAITDPKNPLTARVFVNRVWGRLFGSYLVDTPSDFGTRCERPELAELLDDLTVEFTNHAWSLKWLIRELVMSSAYRQTSHRTDHSAAIDPENRRFACMNRRRLDFEAMRDAILSVSGQLQAEIIGGPSVDVSGENPVPRRSVYAHIDRQNFAGLFRSFDVALPDTHNPKRFETTVPQQALYLLNSPFALHSAAQLAESSGAADGDPRQRIVAIYRQALARDPDRWELERAMAFVSGADQTARESDAWAQLAQVLLLSNEFLYLD